MVLPRASREVRARWRIRGYKYKEFNILPWGKSLYVMGSLAWAHDFNDSFSIAAGPTRKSRPLDSIITARVFKPLAQNKLGPVGWDWQHVQVKIVVA